MHRQLFSIGVLVTLLALSWLMALRKTRRLSDARAAHIVDGKGYMKLSGVARASGDRWDLDPIRHQRCLWYHVRTQPKSNVVTRYFFRLQFVTLATRWSTNSFLLDDGTGVCRLTLSNSSVDEFSLGSNDVVEEGNVVHTLSLVQPGDRLYAYGVLKPLASSESGAKHELVGEEGRPLSIALGYNDPSINEEFASAYWRKAVLAGAGILLGIGILAWSFD
jgi:hypothetical protein